VALAYHDSDVGWVQDLCLSLLADHDPGVRGTAALCLGHLARIHGTLDLHRVVPALKALLNDPEVRGTVMDAMDDIQIFIKDQKTSEGS
jgi:HEAT repeat protein